MIMTNSEGKSPLKARRLALNRVAIAKFTFLLIKSNTKKGILSNVFFQKEGISLFDSDGKQSMLFPILVSVLGVVSQMERENIKFRLNSGRKLYKERGGKLGRKVGSVKTEEQMKEQYKEVIKCLKKGYSVANTLAICKSKGVKCSTSTIKRIKKEFLN